MIRLASSLLLIQSFAPFAIAQVGSPFVGRGPVSHPGYLEVSAHSLDAMPSPMKLLGLA